ncbi:MAG: poly-gamma-glutamate system protein [Marinisporobacter sp.]|jgi:poly-gamma-glutamate system protein|nr:poly-gamma-glutamate system protein [Marinisporobacter sp.]
MKKKFHKKDYILVGLAIGLLLSMWMIESFKEKEKDLFYKEKIAASRLMKKSIEAIKEEKIKRGYTINQDFDKNKTGIIGFEISGITTTLGSLESKRTSSNPNFAAVIIEMLKRAKVNKGDYVAINCSSSFPALNIAVLSAVEVLGIHPVVISSIGSSTWGANTPEFTYMDMEELLYNKGILKNKSIAISLGGAKDIGQDMDQQIVSKIVKRAQEYNRLLIDDENLHRNIQRRYHLYLENSPKIKLFINVGGNMVSMGKNTDMIDLEPGLTEKKQVKIDENSGLMQLFLSKNIPVIHLLNIKKLAVAYGLPVDPQPLPQIGEGEVYFRQKYPKQMVLFVLAMMGIITFIYGKKVKYDE